MKAQGARQTVEILLVRGRTLALGCLLGMTVLMVGCSRSTPQVAVPTGDQPTTPVAVPKEEQPTPSAKAPTSPEALSKLVREFNQAAAKMDQYRYHNPPRDAIPAWEAVVAQAPDWEAARFNLGLAYLNDVELTNKAKAKEAFETVLKSNPNHLPALFALGVYYKNGNKPDEALECFQTVFKADSTDPSVAYQCGNILMNKEDQDKHKEGIKMLELTLRLDPGYTSAAYALFMQYRLSDQPKEAQKLLQRFEDLKKFDPDHSNFMAGDVYGEGAKYYRVLGVDNLPLKPPQAIPVRRVVFSPGVKRLSQESTAWDWGGGLVGLPGIAVGDVDGDGHLDLCLAGVGPGGSVRIWKNDGKGEFTPGPVLIEKGVSPSLGDVENKSKLDLWLGTSTGAVLFKNDGKGNFTRRNRPAPTDTKALTALTRLLDIDSDGDLDLLAFRLGQGSLPATGTAAAAPCSIYQNNRDGSFQDIAARLGLSLPQTAVAAVLWGDFDNDLDPDLLVFPVQGKPIAFVNDRANRFHRLDAAATGLDVQDVIFATTGDPNKDGKLDLLIFAKDGLHLFLNQGQFRFKEDEDFRSSFGGLGGTGGQFADMNNDGHLDIVIADAHRRDGTRGPVILLNDWPDRHFLDAAALDQGSLLQDIKFKGDASCVVADFCGQGRCDILLAPIGEAPLLLSNVTPGGHWIELDLVGLRKNKGTLESRCSNSPVGVRVEIRTGQLIQQYFLGAPSGPVAQPPLRLHAGLGDNTRVDWVRIFWPDGTLQGEVDLPADQVKKIELINLKPSSCPHLFAWDGTHFRFISDFGGKGGLGYLLAPGQYAPPDPREHVRLPALKPLHGEYVLQVMEPLEEVVYLDEAKLIAVDHPVGTEVYPNEMMAVNAPRTSSPIFCIKKPIEPVRAVDHRGQDVTEALRQVDRRVREPPRWIGASLDLPRIIMWISILAIVSGNCRPMGGSSCCSTAGWSTAIPRPISPPARRDCAWKAPSIQVLRGPLGRTLPRDRLSGGDQPHHDGRRHRQGAARRPLPADLQQHGTLLGPHRPGPDRAGEHVHGPGSLRPQCRSALSGLSAGIHAGRPAAEPAGLSQPGSVGDLEDHGGFLYPLWGRPGASGGGRRLLRDHGTGRGSDAALCGRSVRSGAGGAKPDFPVEDGQLLQGHGSAHGLSGYGGPAALPCHERLSLSFR